MTARPVLRLSRSSPRFVKPVDALCRPESAPELRSPETPPVDAPQAVTALLARLDHALRMQETATSAGNRRSRAGKARRLRQKLRELGIEPPTMPAAKTSAAPSAQTPEAAMSSNKNPIRSIHCEPQKD